MKKYQDLESKKKSLKTQKVGWMIGIAVVIAAYLYRAFVDFPTSNVGKILIITFLFITYLIWALGQVRSVIRLEKDVKKEEVIRHSQEKEMRAERSLILEE